MLSSYFYDLADGELTKERALLQEKFGRAITGKYGDKDFAKNLINGINECLGIKAIFERNLALIQESKGQKGVMSYFPDYFTKAWAERADTIWEEVAKRYTESNNLLPGDALAQVVNEKLPSLVKTALEKMFSAKVESGIKKEREKYQDAYQEMADALNKNISGTEEFVQAFIENYKLNEIGNILQQEMIDQQNFADLIKNKAGGFNIRANLMARGGLTMEDVRAYIFNMVGEQFSNIHGNQNMQVSVAGIKTGNTKAKPDSMGVIDIPLDVVSDWLEKNSFGTREKNIKAAVQLQERLRKFDDGFITYVNAKNYTLNEMFEKGGVMANGEVRIPGFSAGAPITLSTFQTAAAIMEMNYDEIVRSCMQLIPGAIGEEMKPEIETSFAKAIASALFDDFNVIGTVETQGARSIHLLDLNGILLPLSFYFYLLGEAFKGVAELPVESLVRVDIETPGNILFPDKPTRNSFGRYEGSSYARWTAQRIDALDRIKITWHFLAAFRSIMQQFM